jgi:peptidoglycan-associated lipoprotein
MKRNLPSIVLAASLSLVVVGAAAWAGTDMSKTKRATQAPETGSQSAKPADVKPTIEGFEPALELGPVYFGFNRAEIRSADTGTLEKSAEWLKAHPEYRVVVEGGADQRGTVPYNRTLAERRANAVKTYLTEHGVPAERIITVSYGKERLACREADKGCWAKNRRVDFLVKEVRLQAP